jgi:hypothetical protein
MPLAVASSLEPYRGAYGRPRPARLSGLALPPATMPARHGLRALKAWRYVGVFGPELMLCVAVVRIGPARQSFWAVWDRLTGKLDERTWYGDRGLRLSAGGAELADEHARMSLRLEEAGGVEVVSPIGDTYGWTRKQGGVPAYGSLELSDGRSWVVRGRAVVDDTAAYYPRHTSWRWSAGVGTAADGRSVAWNLVDGVNDPPRASERTVWIDGNPAEPDPVRFSGDLGSVAGLRFRAEAVRERRENLLVVRSRYRQPFGTFSGELPGGTALESGYGVMEDHDVWW